MRREILIDSAGGEVRVAVLEDGVLVELAVERPGRGAVAGNVYKGRVRNILPGMDSAFVDIGLLRDAFLHVEDLIPGPIEDEGMGALPADEEEPPGEPAGPARPAPAAIGDLVREGQEIVVQVRKDPIGQKGARITTLLSLPGRFVVLLPQVAHVGVSRRIRDEAERGRLRTIVEGLVREGGAPGGAIVRTAAEGRPARDLADDLRGLSGRWQEIRRRAESAAAPALLHAELGAVARVLRDLATRDVRRVLVDSEALREEAADCLSAAGAPSAVRLEVYDGAAPLFAAHNLEIQIERALRPRVWLKSGGSIVINPTEALVAVDVNTGKYVGRRRLEETILRTNVEAAREIVRQLRLRDLGGIIVIDFIDMEEAASRAAVLSALEEELQRDRAKSRLLPLSPFGLVEITRQRTRTGLDRLLTVPCAACGGAGRVRSPETIVHEVVREVRRLAAGGAPGTAVVRAHPEIAARLAAPVPGEEARPLPVRLEVQADAALRPDQWSVVLR